MTVTNEDKTALPLRDTVIPPTRGYQQEMLEESLHRNIIIALDTGSGKTHIALLRMKLEAEREPSKVSWFLAPTVTLCEQQKNVIEASLPVSVGYVSGAMAPDQWKDATMWEDVLRTHRIMVTTPQVLLDALRHGYIRLGRDVNLIVFDEAHHAVSNHPYNRIMQEFYFDLPGRNDRGLPQGDRGNVRPMIMGLTASPIYGGDAFRAFRTIERNLDSTIRAPILNRTELATFVHRPVFKHVMYSPHQPGFSTNLATIISLIKSLDINDDPKVKALKQKFQSATPNSAEWRRLDQQLSSTIQKKDTFVHKGLRDLVASAEFLLCNIGTWTADWYTYTVVEHAKAAANPYNNIMINWTHEQKRYLLQLLNKLELIPISEHPIDVLDEISDKVTMLVKCLLAEKAEAEARNEAYSGIVFVERRDAVLALTELLKLHPRLKGVFNIGYLFGQSDNARRHSLLDVTRYIVKDTQKRTLNEFRIGDKNLIISTAVAEEGIDIQACGSVIRWDLPTNMASWAQSRGRARRKRSTFTLMFTKDGVGQANIAKWQKLEDEMVRLYNDPSRSRVVEEDLAIDDDDYGLELRHESTGALITLHSAISHLFHFCSVIPNTSSGHVDNRPLFDIYPPDMPEGWHEMTSSGAAANHLRGPPFGSTVTLPKCLNLPNREFTVECIYGSRISAHRHVALKAYSELWSLGLLNDHLLPITSMMEPERDDEVKEMLKDVEKRASTANVSLQMNPWAADETTDVDMDGDDWWWCSTLTIANHPSFFFFMRREPIEWMDGDAPLLYRPGQEPLKVHLLKLERVSGTTKMVEEAREFTRRLFWCFNSSRMEWDRLDFAYLFLPCEVNMTWDERRAMMLSLSETNLLPGDEVLARADHFGELFDYPEDFTVVKHGLIHGKAYQFVRWRREPLSAEEEEEVRSMNRSRKGDIEVEITYPLLVVRPLPPRTNFLIHITQTAVTKEPSPAEIKYLHLLPRRCRIPLLSPDQVDSAFLMPSVLRAVSMSTTVLSLSKSLFSGSLLSFIPIQLLINAMTAPAAGEQLNYQRLETLGDTVLKFMTTQYLLAEYPFWHEGYLARKKDHTVANVRLAKANIKHHLYRWIIRDCLISKKWRPLYEAVIVPPGSSPPESEGDGKNKKASKTQSLSTKVLADVVESLIGAAYIHGGLDLGYDCIQFFGLGLNWMPTQTHIIDAIQSRCPLLDIIPPQLALVEKMLGYTFTRKSLLIEALTHGSHESNSPTPSYERMELLGDAVLDIVVTDYLYRAPGKMYSPGHIHLRRSAVVNIHFLAYICMRTSVCEKSVIYKPTGRRSGGSSDDETDINGKAAYHSTRYAPPPIEKVTEQRETFLYQCMLHSSPRVLEDLRDTAARFEKYQEEISAALLCPPNTNMDTGGNTDSRPFFPWSLLTLLQAPKFLSDIIESLIGAVFLDSGGNLDLPPRSYTQHSTAEPASEVDAVHRVLRKLGVLDVLEWIVQADVDVFHPVSQLHQWASKKGRQVEYRMEKGRGKVGCVVLLDGEVVKVKVKKRKDKGKGREQGQGGTMMANAQPPPSAPPPFDFANPDAVLPDFFQPADGSKSDPIIVDDDDDDNEYEEVPLKASAVDRGGRAPMEQVKFAVAEAAIRVFRLRGVRENVEIMQRRKGSGGKGKKGKGKKGKEKEKEKEVEMEMEIDSGMLAKGKGKGKSREVGPLSPDVNTISIMTAMVT
ncbi:hypothetical protein AMATHDRAFT_63058 [Amanita thiersii Skay4041]|uniref:P-loop containing nucleoside triphosphate hydrolase protein n=1 Tax=Amanita thiersii Skay4041 TaxID=703135 RepID=A0A2A9NP84_9AGAR|nr:hypothetical protein AMATHDRAFT_63058 [Amanita thiersii Skay4041]